MIIACQVDGCSQPPTFHITDKVNGVTLHYCEDHARAYLKPLVSEDTSPNRSSGSSYCGTCGHNNKSHDQAGRFAHVFRCPDCARELRDITGEHHDVLTDTRIQPDLIRASRVVPINEAEGMLTVAHDFEDLERVEKLKFVLNMDWLVVYASPQHIDSLIDKLPHA